MSRYFAGMLQSKSSYPKLIHKQTFFFCGGWLYNGVQTTAFGDDCIWSVH